MRLPKFEHLRPTSIREAAQLLKEYGPRARIVAGGTDLFPRMKYGLDYPEIVVSLKRVPAKSPTVMENGDLSIDPLMSLADLANSSVVLERIPLLGEAALSVGSNQIRHMGTLGGNLCQENRCLYYNQSHAFQFIEPCFKRNGDRCYLMPEGKRCLAVFSSDTAPALISLGAILKITDSEKVRQLPVEKLYTGNGRRPHAISEGEIVSELMIPARPSWTGGAFIKFSIRGGMEYGALNIAVVLEMEAQGTSCLGARITVGAVSTAPIRALKAEEIILGQPASKDLFQEVAKTVAADAHPFPHHGYSITYLRECLRVQALRALTLASEHVGRH